MNTKSVKKIFIYGSIALILGVAIYLFTFYQSVTDLTDVKIDGYVYDELTNQPLDGVMVTINNERYESDNGTTNYDEYLGHDVIKLVTDKSGHYTTVISKSAFLWIDFEKEGFSKTDEEGQYSSKKMEYKTFMKKNN